MNSLINILVERDGYSRTEAKEVLSGLKSEILDLLEEGLFEEAESLFSDTIGLELDYMDMLLV